MRLLRNAGADREAVVKTMLTLAMGSALLVAGTAPAVAADSERAAQTKPSASPRPTPSQSAASSPAADETPDTDGTGATVENPDKGDNGDKKARKKAKKSADKPQFTKEKVPANLSPGGDARYGVGQLVTLQFGRDIIRKKAVERSIQVRSKKALPKGSWGWIDSNTAIYRPKRFWPGNAKIKFQVRLRGVVLGKVGDTKYVGRANTTHILRTDRSLILRIRDAKHRLYVERNGKVVKRFPVSLGKSEGGYQTRSGIKIITGEKYARLRMIGTDRLSGETWDVVAPYSIRLTPTGEYIHGAPWAYARMGRYNGSHGCTNMYIDDARWLFNRVKPGDPTVTRGTGRPMEVTNGTPGSYWNYPWKQWRSEVRDSEDLPFCGLDPGSANVIRDQWASGGADRLPHCRRRRPPPVIPPCT